MADLTLRAPQRQPKRADIDTTLPYQNVKAAVRMFGERVDAKTIKLHQKHGAIDAEVHQLQEDLANTRAQLADAEKDKTRLLVELEDLRKLGEPKQISIHDAGSMTDDMEQGSPSCGNEKHVVLEIELNEARVQHMATLAQLRAAKEELKKLEQELTATQREKVCAMKQAEEALATAEINARRAEELSNEISGTKESLVLVKMACVEANKEREALLAARTAEMGEQRSLQTSAQAQDSVPVNKLEENLAAAKEDFSKEQLRMVRNNLVAAREALVNVDKLKQECGSPVKDATIAIELEAAKLELSKALDNEVYLQSSLKELEEKLNGAKLEVSVIKSELADMRRREASASSEVVSLSSELERVKGELRSAVSCNEAFVGFSQKLQEMAISEGGDQAADEDNEGACKAYNAEAKAELQALMKEHAEAARPPTALRQKTSHSMFLGLSQADAQLQAMKRDRLETLHEDTMIGSNNNDSLASSQGESLAQVLNTRMPALDKEDHKKKKKLALPSLGAFLSKRKSQKLMSSTKQET